MNNKTLLAFLLALQETETNPAWEDLCDKWEILSLKSQITPKNWENLQSKLEAVLKNNAAMNQHYQAFNAQLEKVQITSDLLPTLAELEAVKSDSREVDTLGYHPGKDDGESNEVPNIMVIAYVISSNKAPEKVAKTLLQRLSDWLKRK